MPDIKFRNGGPSYSQCGDSKYYDIWVNKGPYHKLPDGYWEQIIQDSKGFYFPKALGTLEQAQEIVKELYMSKPSWAFQIHEHAKVYTNIDTVYTPYTEPTND